MKPLDPETDFTETSSADRQTTNSPSDGKVTALTSALNAAGLERKPTKTVAFSDSIGSRLPTAADAWHARITHDTSEYFRNAKKYFESSEEAKDKAYSQFLKEYQMPKRDEATCKETALMEYRRILEKEFYELFQPYRNGLQAIAKAASEGAGCEEVKSMANVLFPSEESGQSGSGSQSDTAGGISEHETAKPDFDALRWRELEDTVFFAHQEVMDSLLPAIERVTGYSYNLKARKAATAFEVDQESEAADIAKELEEIVGRLSTYSEAIMLEKLSATATLQALSLPPSQGRLRSPQFRREERDWSLNDPRQIAMPRCLEKRWDTSGEIETLSRVDDAAEDTAQEQKYNRELSERLSAAGINTWREDNHGVVDDQEKHLGIRMGKARAQETGKALSGWSRAELDPSEEEVELALQSLRTFTEAHQDMIRAFTVLRKWSTD